MRKKIGFWEAFNIGVGGMIGGGIFAVLGLSIQLAKSSAPLAFFFAGIVALTTAYSYAKLTVRYPSEGGTIEFITRAYGTGIFFGGLNVLLLASYVVMISLYAYAFGSYAANALGFEEMRVVFTVAVIALFTVLNALGAVVSGRTEDILVTFKLLVLLVVAGAGVAYLNPERLSPAHWAEPVNIVAGGMIIFLAYEGFELISNSAADVENPKILPKAFYASVILVIAIYVAIATVTVGTLPYNKIVEARDYALAIAAEPSLGEMGFWFVTLAALASTSSAINATVYGTARVSYMVARFGQLPEVLERRIWRQAYEGLVIVSFLAIIMSSFASLDAIATAGSGGFLLIFSAVNFAAYRLRNNLRIRPEISAAGTVLTLAAFLVLSYRMMETNVNALTIMFMLIALSFALELGYRRFTGRAIREYIDRKLENRERNIRNWHTWINDVVRELGRQYDDSEIYLVGSVARDEIEKANDVDLLIFSGKVKKGEEVEVMRKVRDKLGLTPQHCVDLHFESKEAKEEALRRVGKYRRLR